MLLFFVFINLVTFLFKLKLLSYFVPPLPVHCFNILLHFCLLLVFAWSDLFKLGLPYLMLIIEVWQGLIQLVLPMSLSHPLFHLDMIHSMIKFHVEFFVQQVFHCLRRSHLFWWCTVVSGFSGHWARTAGIPGWWSVETLLTFSESWSHLLYWWQNSHGSLLLHLYHLLGLALFLQKQFFPLLLLLSRQILDLLLDFLSSLIILFLQILSLLLSELFLLLSNLLVFTHPQYFLDIVLLLLVKYRLHNAQATFVRLVNLLKHFYLIVNFRSRLNCCNILVNNTLIDYAEALRGVHWFFYVSLALRSIIVLQFHLEHIPDVTFGHFIVFDSFYFSNNLVYSLHGPLLVMSEPQVGYFIIDRQLLPWVVEVECEVVKPFRIV